MKKWLSFEWQALTSFTGNRDTPSFRHFGLLNTDPPALKHLTSEPMMAAEDSDTPDKRRQTEIVSVKAIFGDDIKELPPRRAWDRQSTLLSVSELEMTVSSLI